MWSGIEEKIIQQVQLFQFFFFHSASACSFPYDGGNSIVSAEFICAVVLFPPYLFQFHMWNQIDRTALELSQICNFSVANDGRRVNHGMKKATGWMMPVCDLVGFYTFFRKLSKQISFLYFPDRGCDPARPPGIKKATGWVGASLWLS